MLSVSEYVTTNVTAKPVTFLHGTNGCTVVSHMCSCNTLTVQGNNLSNSIPHRKNVGQKQLNIFHGL